MKKSPKETLRKSRLKATPARIAIVEIFQKAKQPLAAQDIIDRLSIDQATAYRTFKSLKEKGVIRPIDLRHNHAHYELADMAEHHHIVCVFCSKVEDVRECGIEDTQKTVLRSSRHFSEIRDHALEFYGVCKACAKKGLSNKVV